MRDWHPDYRTILVTFAAFALMTAAWGVVALIDQAGSTRNRAKR